jgi:hypothetical protein
LTEQTEPSTEIAERPGFFRRLWLRLLALYSPSTLKQRGWLWGTSLFVITYAVIALLLSFYWSWEPGQFDVVAVAKERAEERGEKLVTGYATVSTAMEIANTLLSKPGGYLSNDKLPPSTHLGGYWFMDNMPNWEFGVLVQIRDFSKSLRNEIGRSQSLDQENKDLSEAEPRFNVNNYSWLVPAAESEYQTGIQYWEKYLGDIVDPNKTNAQFFARADNLREWLKVVARRLGSLSKRLSASVGENRVNVDLAGEGGAESSTPQDSIVVTRTPWLEIDDVFYEARGTCWALIHLFRAIETDFAGILKDKNAARSVSQIIRELEATQRTMWSPVVLNGSDFGLFANHSLVMSSYVARAASGVIELRDLLDKG